MRGLPCAALLCAILISAGCSRTEVAKAPEQAPPSYFKVDSATAGTVKGVVRFTGRKPAAKPIDMSEDPACVAANHGKVLDESVVVNPNGTLANVFVYVKSGLEGKNFEVPSAPVTIDQHGCGFRPRVMGIQTGQTLKVTNSDPVTHNIHPLPEVNREWNHSQGSGDAPLARKFTKPEVMIRVKCNIHPWMRAFIGAVDNPYFAVTAQDGTFALPNMPPGEYVLGAWHEKLGAQEQKVSIAPSGAADISFSFKGE